MWRAPVVAALSQLLAAASGHGSMYEPPTRNSRGLPFADPNCPGGTCYWFSQGTSIGCPRATGHCENGSAPGYKPTQGVPMCTKAEGLADPTIGTSEADRHLRTYNVDGNTHCAVCPDPKGDWTAHNPWRKPGSAPVEDPCGMASGMTAGSGGAACTINGGETPIGAKQGDVGSQLPKLLQTTVWIAGGTAEVGWGVMANHGGGYSYRLCPAASKLTEDCFQQTPLEFVGDTQWIQYGNGMDATNRTEITADQVSVGTVPSGSQWRRNPIPACDNGFMGGSTCILPCNKPNFPPKIPGLFGYPACGTPGKPGRIGIVDKLKVPDVPPGDYVLGFRWDMEQTSQVWQSCADVRIKTSGTQSTPFKQLSGCDPCCGAGLCAGCEQCGDDRTGDCARCWKAVAGTPGSSQGVTCLGPGSMCAQCWAEKDACTAGERP